ncbi:hypothetical protein AURDEDRAFT_124071 [Auricularia subglabra TFB-10046 SS5]|nr:hypothetical protein AURDEDRAFT_124071 [Auricularia subglabra TFB-10046 SS5]
MPTAKKPGEQIQPASPPAPPPLMPKKGKGRAAPEKAPEKPKGQGGANGKKKGAASGQGNGNGAQNPPLRRSARNQKEPLEEAPPPPPPPKDKVKAQKKDKGKPPVKKKPSGKNVPAPEPDLVDEHAVDDDEEEDVDDDDEDEPEPAPPPPKSKNGKKAAAKKNAPPLHVDDVFADTTNKKKGTAKKKVAFSDVESDDGRSSRFSEARQSDTEGMEVDSAPLTPMRPVDATAVTSAWHWRHARTTWWLQSAWRYLCVLPGNSTGCTTPMALDKTCDAHARGS